MKDLESLKALIKEHVSLGELLKHDGRITNLIEEEQFSCPFHGVDRKKSSRYYRSTDTAYCWVCKEKWDAISYVRKKEGIGFGEVINRFIKEYSIDISQVPDVIEETVQKFKEKTVPKIDDRKLATERIKMAILASKEDVEPEIYAKFIYSYMMLKYVVTDEKFQEQFTKLKDGMLRVFERIRRL